MVNKDIFNIRLLDKIVCVGPYELPEIAPCNKIPKIDKIISFNYAMSVSNPEDCFVHFYIDDYQFERIWSCPERYINILQRFKGVIAPDFSVYLNMPKAQQIFQVYKARLITAYMQKKGINVIPNIVWSDEQSLEFCLDGLPINSVVALSTNGCLNKEVKPNFIKMFNIVMSKLQPKQIIVIGSVPAELKDKRIVEISSHINRLRCMYSKGATKNGRTQ